MKQDFRIILHGYAISNYYNRVKMALRLKNIPFEENRAVPSQDETFLRISPMGLIPVLQVNDFYLTETQSILEFLEEAYPQSMALLGTNAFGRARVRQAIAMIDLYIDSPARKIFNLRRDGHVEMVTEKFINLALLEVNKGIKALSQIATFNPFLVSEVLTFADLAAASTLLPFHEFFGKYLPENALENNADLQAYLGIIRQNEIIREIEKDRQKKNAVLQRAKAIDKKRK